MSELLTTLTLTALKEDKFVMPSKPLKLKIKRDFLSCLCE